MVCHYLALIFWMAKDITINLNTLIVVYMVNLDVPHVLRYHDFIIAPNKHHVSTNSGYFRAKWFQDRCRRSENGEFSTGSKFQYRGIDLQPKRILATSLKLLGQLNNAGLFWVFARFGQHDLFTLMNWMFLYAAEEALSLRKMLRPSEFRASTGWAWWSCTSVRLTWISMFHHYVWLPNHQVTTCQDRVGLTVEH